MRSSRAVLNVAAIAACLPALVIAAPACAVAEKDLVGAWGRPTGAAFFQEFELAREDGERLFNSWLHQRPEVSGASWTYVQCRLHIEASRNPSMAWDYTVAMRGRTRLVLHDADGTTTYRRLGK